ncbi:MAG: rhamnogalacturonan acetylesterase [Paludibacteraceae bacterium]|nr:rhamnogalacturonan acetylesterase [Paludibacteraceae bacterium]
MKKTLFLASFIAVIATLIAMKNKPVRILMAGDSTMADKEQIAYPETGWGQVLPSYFDDDVVIENHARNGRSTRTFISEGRWDFLLSHVQKGDYVVIQFGHNDQSVKKADRYTTPEQYKQNLTKMVNDTKAKGGIPILCTPIERRKFDKSGNFVDQHGNYPNLARQVAQEQNVIFVDMQHSSMDFIIAAGDSASCQYFLHVKPGECQKHPEGKIDNTHLKPVGALAMANLFIEGLQQQSDNKQLKQLLKHVKKSDNVTLTYTTPVAGINKLANKTNNQIDEGEKGQKQ